MNAPSSILENGLRRAYISAASTVMALPPEREECPQTTAHVVAVRDLCPAFRRVTLAAPGLAGLELLGPDEYVGLYLPRPGVPLRMPEPAWDARKALNTLPEAERPDLRWYTIRAHRPGSGEIDVDVVSTGHEGPGARWIGRVAAGDTVGVRVQTAPYAAAPDTGHHVLVADETGLPGLLAIIEEHAAHNRASHLTGLAEVPGPEHLHEEVIRAGIEPVFRQDAKPGSAVLPLLDTAIDEPVDFAWVCAEGGTAAAVKSALTRRHGMPRRSVFSSGFWRMGKPRP